MVGLTRDDLERQRSARRLDTATAQARLASQGTDVDYAGTPTGGSGAKPSRLESMRSALGLSSKKSPAPSTGGGEAAPGRSPSRLAGGSSRGGRTSLPAGNVPAARSMGRSPGGSKRDLEAQPEESPSSWKRVFSRK
jgi:hypothetical protein